MEQDREKRMLLAALNTNQMVNVPYDIFFDMLWATIKRILVKN